MKPERYEYPRIVHYVEKIAGDFGVNITAVEMHAIHVMAATTNVIDFTHDSECDADKRAEIARGVSRYLLGKGEAPTPEIASALDDLNEVIPSQEARKEIVEAAEGILIRSERIRNAKCVSEVLEDIYEEGELAMKLCLSLFSGRGNGFEEYMRLLGGTSNLIDDMVDSEKDIASGERKYQLGFMFQLHMLKKILPKLVQIILGYPKKKRLLYYLMKSIPAMSAYARRTA